jgi:hypothetical protein
MIRYKNTIITKNHTARFTGTFWKYEAHINNSFVYANTLTGIKKLITKETENENKNQ